MTQETQIQEEESKYQRDIINVLSRDFNANSLRITISEHKQVVNSGFSENIENADERTLYNHYTNLRSRYGF